MTDGVSDHISICGLEMTARLGVPALERAVPQRLTADVTLYPSQPLENLDDELSRTVDYAAAAGVCHKVASHNGRKLLESLAGEICTALLTGFPLRKVCLTLRKFILSGTQSVAVTLVRTNP